MKNFLLAICLVFFSAKASSQTDTAFWFVAPEVTVSHGDNPVFLRFTTLSQAASITISQPANAGFTPITITIAANSSQSVNLTSNLANLENAPGNQVLNKGLFIKSNNPVTAYYEVSHNNNPEIFALKGRNALGKSFFIPAQNLMGNNTSFPVPANSSFDIVATEDNTTVIITPAKAVQGHAAGVPYNIILNKGQTYSAVATSFNAADHLMGSTVTSNKPVAITIKDDSLTGGGIGSCSDLAGDQIIPVNLLGSKHIILPGYLTANDNVFILAVTDNTSITINGANVTTINKGQTFRQTFSQVLYIETSNPVYVLHLSGFGCEVGHAVVPQIECTGSKIVGVTRGGASNESFYMNILVKTGGEGLFTFNGGTNIITSASFNVVPNTNNAWKYARIQLSTSQLNVGDAAIIKNSGFDFHLGIINGGSSSGCRYGYFSDFSRFDGALASSNSPVCEGNNIQLSLNFNQGTGDGFTYNWMGPNNFTSTDRNPVITNASIASNGVYTCIISKPGCSSDGVTTTVEVRPGPAATATANKNIFCDGETLFLTGLSSVPGVNYSWTGPNNFSASQQNTQLALLTPASSGTYTLAVGNGACTSQNAVNIVVNKVSDFTVQVQPYYCTSNPIIINQQVTQAGAGDNFLWSGPASFSSAATQANVPNAQAINAGNYTLTYSAPGCADKSQVATVIMRESPVAAASAITPVCADAPLQLNAANSFTGTDYTWSGPGNFNSIIQNPLINNIAANASGNYIVMASFNGCSTKDTVDVTVNPVPSAKIIAQSPACRFSNAGMQNNNTVAATNYTWSGPNSFSASTQNIVLNNFNDAHTGKYYLTASANGCNAIDSFTMSIKESPVVSFAPLNNICEERPRFAINGFSETTGIAGAYVLSGAGVNSAGFFVPANAGAGTHNIRYTYNANNGCSAFVEQPITVYPTPVINAGTDKTILEGNSVKLNAAINAQQPVIVWTPAATLDFNNIINPSAKPLIDTRYELKVTSDKGCEAKDSVFVKVLKNITIPNVFSPNGDGINDKWQVKNLSDFNECDVEIFNRYGQSLFKSKGYSIQWDGKYNGKLVPVGTYYYIINLNDGFRNQPFSGWVQVLW